jgi:thiamine biosynthesis protein ThiI
MQYDHILIRYGELSLKGKNRSKFIDKLKANLKGKLREFPDIRVKKSRHRMFIELNGQKPEPIIEKIRDVFGIQSYSLALKTNSEIEDIKKGAIHAIKEAGAINTFKVSAKRADKSFPIPSQELNHVIGGHVLQNKDDIKVDVHHPDVNLKVEVRQESTYITCADYKGAGGLPIGTGGRVMLMLSGGIDSPVAGYMLMKRGVEIEAVHFYSPPFTSERAKQKVVDLVEKLTKYGSKIRLHIVPFTKMQQYIHEKIPENYTMTSMRRNMLRITEELAKKNEGLALATGENLGQVASQTLESINTINEVTNFPILRPLITMDKLDIIKIAHQIDTYDISIRPYEDCCTIFLPSAPKTKPRREKMNHFEGYMDGVDALIDEAVENTEVIEITGNKEKTEKAFDDLL